jgi:hypothetical protein
MHLQSWLVALGLDNASQWKDIVKEACKGGLFIIIVDRLWMQSNDNWCALRLLACCLLLRHAALLANAKHMRRAGCAKLHHRWPPPQVRGPAVGRR